MHQEVEFVLGTLAERNVPCAVVMAGGYGEVQDVVDIHANTVAAAARRWGAARAVALR